MYNEQMKWVNLHLLTLKFYHVISVRVKGITLKRVDIVEGIYIAVKCNTADG